jgi:ABC-2 type transport system ATP-binding protein
MLASILAPTRGTASVAGFDTVRQASEVRRIIGMLTEHHGLYTRMRAQDYLSFYAKIYGLDDAQAKARIHALLTRFELGDAMRQRLGQYSKGMRQKLAMVRALLHEPRVLLLDEPTSAMDPSSSRLVRESITGLRSDKRAIVVCTHNLNEAELLADRIAIIRKGRIIAQGSAQELKQKFLGFPLMELRLADPLNGLLDHLPADLRILDQGPTWLRYEAPDPANLNPIVLAAVASAGARAVTLAEVGRSLEDVYLQVVQREQGDMESDA